MAVRAWGTIGIIQKLALGYVLIILVPSIAIGALFYRQTMAHLLDSYAGNKQQNMEQLHASIQVRLKQIESVYNLVQYDPNVVELLNESLATPAEKYYSFLRYVRPLLANARVNNPDIADITLYYMDDRSGGLAPEFSPIGELDARMERIGPLRQFQGVWLAGETSMGEEAPTVAYYQKIYSNYAREIGVMEVRASPAMMAQFTEMMRTSPKEDVYLTDGSTGEIVYRSEPISLPQVTAAMLPDDGDDGYGFFEAAGERMLLNAKQVGQLDFRFYNVERTGDVLAGAGPNWLVPASVFAALLLLLSVVYYVIAVSISRRILRLARHMRKDGQHLREYPEDNGRDEVGLLTLSYNGMVRRVEELIRTVHRSELSRKELAYSVLQAQIKPHFLYNTLESIRMLAQMKETDKVVEMTYSLGQLLRYSLSKNQSQALLSEELEDVRHYMAIQSIRLEDRMRFELSVRVNPALFVCPRFILQPLLENSIKHGISQRLQGGTIRLEVWEDERHLHVSIADDGPGMPPERLTIVSGVLDKSLEYDKLRTETGGVGLYNVHERIMTFYGPDARMTIENGDPRGIRIFMALPKERQGGEEDA